MEIISDVAFTPAVKAEQQRLGSRDGYAKMEARGGWSDEVDAELAGFLSERDSFYLGTASAEGQPYIQHRGGKPGFLKVIGEKLLAFAEFRGNRQYISMGNVSENDKAFIFLMDYPNRRRIKIWGRLQFVEDDPELADLVTDHDYQGKVERVALFHVQAWDVNCPQHIMPRYTEEDVAERERVLHERIGSLEVENAALRAAR